MVREMCGKSFFLPEKNKVSDLCLFPCSYFLSQFKHMNLEFKLQMSSGPQGGATRDMEELMFLL